MEKTNTIRPLRRTIFSLQLGRAVAAILVVLYHNSVAIFALPKYGGIKPFGNLFDFGNSGVYFFFVLSGFIILHAHYEDLSSGEVGSYLYRRVVRVYPVYWIILLIILPVYFVDGGFGFGFETQPETIISSFLLIHIGSLHTVITVAWTLFHEMLFYTLFAAAIWSSRLGFCLFMFWFVLSVAGTGAGHHGALSSFYFSDLHLLFGFGMGAALYLRRRSVPLPAMIVLLGVLIFLSAGVDQIHWHFLHGAWPALTYGLGSVAIVIGLVELECSGRIKVPAFLILLGDASYSIYLLHFYVLSALAKLALAGGVGLLLPRPATYAMFACLAIASGTLFHFFIERPILGVLRRRQFVVPNFRFSNSAARRDMEHASRRAGASECLSAAAVKSEGTSGSHAG